MLHLYFSHSIQFFVSSWLKRKQILVPHTARHWLLKPLYPNNMHLHGERYFLNQIDWRFLYWLNESFSHRYTQRGTLTFIHSLDIFILISYWLYTSHNLGLITFCNFILCNFKWILFAPKSAFYRKHIDCFRSTQGKPYGIHHVLWNQSRFSKTLFCYGDP